MLEHMRLWYRWGLKLGLRPRWGQRQKKAETAGRCGLYASYRLGHTGLNSAARVQVQVQVQPSCGNSRAFLSLTIPRCDWLDPSYSTLSRSLSLSSTEPRCWHQKKLP